MKKLTTASLLVTSIIAHSVQAFASKVNGEKNAFARYVIPTPSSLALCHFSGMEINGIVTVDISPSSEGKSATIKVFDDGSLDKESSASLLKFALLKSVNLGCSTAKVIGGKGIVSSEDFSAFGEFKTGSESVEFDGLPHADASTLFTYGYHGMASAAHAMLSIGMGMLTTASESTLGKSFTPAFATSLSSGFSKKS